MTKSEYRAYIASEEWQKRRAEFLSAFHWCHKCKLPRHLAIVAYDQDLHVHHKHYQNVGSETWKDLLALCRRCHEIETFGHSSLHEVKRPATCELCKQPHYNWYEPFCSACSGALHLDGPSEVAEINPPPDPWRTCVWKFVLGEIVWVVPPDEIIKFVKRWSEDVCFDSPNWHKDE